MPFKCPNCDTVHEKVPGYVSQETLTQRLNAKTEEIKTLTAKLEEAGTAAADIAAIRADRDRLQGEVTQLRDAQAVKDAFASHGIADDEDLRGSFRTMYASAMAGVEEAPSFVDWLGSDEAKGHVLLKGHYGQPAAPETPPDPNAPKPAPSRPVPNVNTNTVTPPTPDKAAAVTAADLAGVFASAAYKALPFDRRKALRAQWQEDIRAGRALSAEDLRSQLQSG